MYKYDFVLLYIHRHDPIIPTTKMKAYEHKGDV